MSTATTTTTTSVVNKTSNKKKTHLDDHHQPRQKRFKVGKACFTCRVKKIKCDGLQPCMQCKARKRPCTFSKDGLTDDNMNHNSSSAHNSSIGSPNLSSVPSSPQPSPPSPPPLPSQPPQPSMTTEATEILNRLAKVVPEKEIDITQLYYAKSITTPNMTSKQQQKIIMPTKTIQQHLIQSYFKHCYSTLPIIPKSLFFKQFESSKPKLLTNPILLFMIFAHGAQYQQKTFLDADNYFKQAKVLLDNELAHPKLSTIITLVLMALYDSTENRYVNMYSAMAFQLCFDLDLMRNYSGDYFKLTVNDDLELKKRICWSCYYLDKLIHIQQGQPWIMKRHDIELDLPLLQPGDDVIEHEILEGFSSMIKLLQIAERVLQPSNNNNVSSQPMIRSHSSNNNEQIVSLNNDNELLHWLRSLPSHLQWTPLISNTATPSMPDSPCNPMLCQLHLMYNLVELNVLKPFSTFNAKSIHQRSIAIATNITRLITTLSDNTSWIFHYPFILYALMESTKIHLGDCSFTDNLSIVRHSQAMFQQAIQTLKSFMADKRNQFISSLVTPFLIALDQVLTDATTIKSQQQEEIMTPFVLGSVNNASRQEEEEQRQQQWSKLNYFANGLVTPPIVKSKGTSNTQSNNSHIQYYHPPVMTTQNPFYNTQHSAITDNNLFHLSTSSWRPHSGMTPDRIQYHTFYNTNNDSSWQQQNVTINNRKSPNNHHQQQNSTNNNNDIAAIVAQMQHNKSTNNASTSDTVVNDTNDWNTSNNNNNNNNTNTTNSNQSTPSQHEDLLYSLLQEEVSRPVEQPRYPQYMNVGLGIYASAHQHHNDVIRQHLPVSSNSMRPAAILTHQGQVIVQNNSHHSNQSNNQ